MKIAGRWTRVAPMALKRVSSMRLARMALRVPSSPVRYAQAPYS